MGSNRQLKAAARHWRGCGALTRWMAPSILLVLALLVAACGQAAPAAPTAAPAPKAAAPTQAPAPAAAPTQAPAAAAAPTKPAAPAKLTDFVYGAIGTVGMIPFTAGIKLGVWEKEGLKVEAIEHKGGAEVAQALAGGGVHIAGLDITHVVEMNNANQDVKVMAPGFALYSYKLLAPPGSPFKSAQSLKGKKIGISSPGSSTDNVMRWFLKTGGMDPDKDVELVAIGSGAPMLAALQNKQVDAGMTTEPITSQLESQNYVVVQDFIKDLGPFYNSVYSAKGSWLKANGDIAKAFLRGYFGFLKAMDADAALRTEARKISMPNVPDAVGDKAFKNVLDSYPRKGDILKEGVETPEKVKQVGSGKTTPFPDLSKYVDTSYNP